MNNRILKINFKKLISGYLIAFAVILVSISAFLGIKYKNKIEFIYQYDKLKETFHKKGFEDTLKDKIANFSKYGDVVDVTVIKDDQIVYSLNNIYDNNLTNTNNKKMFIDDQNNVYKLVKKDKLFLNLFLGSFDDEEYEDDFASNNYNNKYFISYINNKKDNSSIVVLSDIVPVPNSGSYFKLAGAVLIFMGMLYWIIVAGVICQNALKSKVNYFLWTTVVLVTNMFGVILYLIYKYNRVTCKGCGKSNSKDSLYCTCCGEKIGKSCSKCSNIVGKNDLFCKSCGKKLK